MQSIFMQTVGIVLLILVMLLLTQRWFWSMVFGLCGLASFFAMVASVIHFEIFAAIGFLILMIIILGIGVSLD